MLQRQNIWKRGGLARRVLRTGLKVVQHSALYGMVIYCIGCVIPTPLDRAPAETNFRPVWVTTRVNPPFGPAPGLIATGDSFSLAATDPNHDDTLTVHLFVPGAMTGTRIYTGYHTTLTIPSTPDSDDPNLRLGTIDSSLCLKQPVGTPFEVYAIVADRDFMGTEARVQEGGLSDENHWEQTCM
jgi:hypothetical protein